MRTAILTLVLLLAFALPLQAQPSYGYAGFASGGITYCGQTVIPHGLG
jgi:hypothetical protein